MYRGKGNTTGPKRRVRQIKPGQLAQDIVASIEGRIVRGMRWSIDDYIRPESIELRQLVRNELKKKGIDA